MLSRELYRSTEGDLDKINIGQIPFSQDADLRGEHVAFMIEAVQCRENLINNSYSKANFVNEIDESQIENIITDLSILVSDKYNKWMSTNRFNAIDLEDYKDYSWDMRMMYALQDNDLLLQLSDFDIVELSSNNLERLPLVQNAQNIPLMSLVLTNNYGLLDLFSNNQISSWAAHTNTIIGSPPSAYTPFEAGYFGGNTIFGYNEFRYSETSARIDSEGNQHFFWLPTYGNSSMIVNDGTARNSVHARSNQGLYDCNYATYTPIFRVTCTFDAVRVDGKLEYLTKEYLICGSTSNLFISRYYRPFESGGGEFRYGIGVAMSNFHEATQKALQMFQPLVNMDPTKGQSPTYENHGNAQTHLVIQTMLPVFICQIKNPWCEIN